MRMVFLFLISVLPVCAQEKMTVNDLAWLAGCWDGSTDKKEATEQWMKPAGNEMFGMSRTVRNGKVTEFEFLHIHQNEQGEIFYTAKPSDQNEASFKLIKKSGTEIIFENPDHDFPQRIIYRLEKNGSLKARIEGKNEGKEMGIDFPMKKMKCE
ncbi:hypothetical protein K1X84_01755 [bacterium]|nr:hypothetical protein [bacterium]